METQSRPNLDIKDFQSISAAQKLDSILMVLSNGIGAKITVDLLLKILLKDIQPSINKNGEWVIGSTVTGEIAVGKSPFLQASENGIEWKYDGETSLRPLVSYEQLRMKFNDLTTEQVEELKMKFTDLTPDEIEALTLKFSDLTPEQVNELSMKFSSLTPEQIQALKLTLADLTPAEIAELQKPANAAITSIQATEELIKASESKRIFAESERTVAESRRTLNESVRITAEDTRITTEKRRADGETERSSAESGRITAESGRVATERARVTAEGKRVTDFATLKTNSETATTAAIDTASHPTYIGDDYFVRRWNSLTKEYEKTDIYVKGDTGLTAYGYAVKGGYTGTEEQFASEQADIVNNSVRLKNVEDTKQNKPIAGRTFLTPLFEACGAKFNSITGFYEYNGLIDITEAQIIKIYIHSSALGGGDWSSAFMGAQARTAFFYNHLDSLVNPTECFREAIIEVINFTMFAGNYSIKFTTGYLMFHQASRLKTILGFIDCRNIKVTHFMFTLCTTLEQVNLWKLSVSISFKDSLKLNKESILYLINNSANTSPIILTLHADAKARLTPEDVALASSKNITIA